ncbi:hypothetical protein Tco_0980999 [Tanacetum coccineum]
MLVVNKTTHTLGGVAMVVVCGGCGVVVWIGGGWIDGEGRCGGSGVAAGVVLMMLVAAVGGQNPAGGGRSGAVKDERK